MRIEDKGIIFRVYEWIINVRAKLFGVIDGDLGMFVQKDVFNRLDGFKPYPAMEDIAFSKKLRQLERVYVLPDTIYVSSRKWHERGFVRTFIEYTTSYLKFWTGSLKNQKNDPGHQSPVSQCPN